MDLSVVIVSYNAVDFLRLTLNSVFAACTTITAEVFVVDNNSSDGAAAMVAKEFPACKLIANQVNPGFAKANNQAIRKAHGKYILILNPDTVVAEDTFTKTIAFMQNTKDAGGMGIRMIDGSGLFLPESKRGVPSPWTALTKMSGLAALFPTSKIFAEYHKGYLSPNKNSKIEVLAGAFMLFKKSVLDKVGLLDEDFFMYGEDIDLSYRVTKHAYANYYFSESSIIHFKGESTIKDKTYVNRFYKAMVQFAHKHFSKSYGIVLKVFIYLGVFVASALSTFKHALLKNKAQNPVANQPTLLFLHNYPAPEDLMQQLEKKFVVKTITDPAMEQQGTLVFVQGLMPYKQMIKTMDTYKCKFNYRFLDLQAKVMLGSDNKLIQGQTIAL
ncbi:Glycosyltransferase, GT2 family [Saccharicrinis carchari]|uniref:Glycosyltransferase, GT2 family n=1 Tax=Saccharicrinis carchari TaxID=1168039 RepID=A0A521DI29_SACCC|nr:glycosyltransferase family 2 protein [Saccharicrinis carchari]SMO71298.1 Glycosyltransferase, GT2 family [Saccharicrinis carchari]